MRSSLLQRTALAAVLAAALVTTPRAADRQLTFEWVDVLGGAATLIVTPAGESILVDTGWPGFDSRDAKRIKAALDKHGLTAIDHLVTTHYHTDHYGGVPQLAALVPIKHFYDHGPMSALPEDRNFTQMYAAYRAAAKDSTTALKPGDTIALKQGSGPKLSLTVVASAGEVIGGTSTSANPACASAVAQPDDTTDNRRSVAFILRYGQFDYYGGGDLTGDVEAKLACPADRVGAVDLYQVTHHGQANSNNPVLLATLKPTVAVMNNGPRKGGAAETFQRLKALPSLKGLFAIHKNVSTGPDVNAAPENIANLEAPDAGHGFRAVVDASAKSFTITNARTNETRSFTVQ
ncbi:MAG: MBL fold metallo-hydrolase [Vicinamibacteraceae bacterium]